MQEGCAILFFDLFLGKRNCWQKKQWKRKRIYKSALVLHTHTHTQMVAGSQIIKVLHNSFGSYKGFILRPLFWTWCSLDVLEFNSFNQQIGRISSCKLWEFNYSTSVGHYAANNCIRNTTEEDQLVKQRHKMREMVGRDGIFLTIWNKEVSQ